MDEVDILKSLFEEKKFIPNKNQLSAILSDDGPLLLTAGPGSGKTRVLLWKTLVLIVFNNVDPSKIFLSTFTEKAALQLRQGLQELLSLASKYTGNSYDISQMYVGTLHSLCQKILKDERFVNPNDTKNKIVLLDDLDQFFFVSKSSNWKEILKAGGYESENSEDYVDFYNEINRWFQEHSGSKMNAVKNCISFFNRMSEEDFFDSDLVCNNCDLENKFFKMTVKYRELLRSQKPEKVDFASIQQKALSVILKSEDNKNIFDYVIVDEYQDTNTIQQKIYMALAAGSKNICVVGDDDQSLYRFRGATVENLINFENVCENFLGVRPARIDLNINYRSRKQIVDAYTSFIEKCNWQDDFDSKKFYRIMDKNIQANSVDEKCAILKATGEKEEVAKNVVDFVKKLKENKTISDYNQCAFLFPAIRGNNDGMSTPVKAYADAFTKAGIPYYAPRARNFLYTDECLITFGVYAAIFDITPDVETSLGGMKSFNEWILESRVIVKSIIEEDNNLFEFIEFKKKEIEKAKEQYQILCDICNENKIELDAPANGSELGILLKDENIKRLSEETVEELSDYKLRDYIITKSHKKEPLTVSYILSRVTSFTWNILDLFYELLEFNWYKDEFEMCKAGDDAGMYNLGLITQYLSKYMEMNSSVISGKSFSDDIFSRSFYNSFLYTLFRKGEGEYENEETPFPSGSVPFLTIHQSKGLEFPVVVLGSVRNQHRQPRPLDVLVRNMLEEKGKNTGLNEPLEMINDFDTMRKFYVALSRAKTFLIISQFTGRGQNTYHPFEQLFLEKEYQDVNNHDSFMLPDYEEKEELETKIYSYKKDYLPYKTCPLNYMVYNKYNFVPSKAQTYFYGSLILRTIQDFQKYINSEVKDE